MQPVSCTNTHHDVTDLVIHGMVKIQKLEYIENGTELFLKINKILNLWYRSDILRSYQFVAEVNFKHLQSKEQDLPFVCRLIFQLYIQKAIYRVEIINIIEIFTIFN